jgi:predicted nucleotidyltransferase
MGKTFAKLLSSPNNILGVEYCKALISLKSHIKPFAVARKDVNHDSLQAVHSIASASYIRGKIINKNEYSSFVPDPSYNIYKNAPVHSLKNIEASIICDLIKTPLCKLRDIADVSEGLENRIKVAALESKTLDELIDKIKTKRYTHSRIRRIILSSYLGVTKADRLSLPQYIKILDHNETGQRLIAAAKKTSSLPIVRNTSQINKLKNTEIKEAWEREKMFDALYLRTESHY